MHRNRGGDGHGKRRQPSDERTAEASEATSFCDFAGDAYDWVVDQIENVGRVASSSPARPCF